MKITIKKFGGDVPTEIGAFADFYGLEMVVRERDAGFCTGSRFYAEFMGAEVMERGFLVSCYGDGSSPNEAIAAYAKELAGKRVAIDPMRPQRRNIDVPNDLHYDIKRTAA